MEKLPNQIKLELSKAASARTSVYEDRRVKELPNASAHAYSLNVAKRMVETAVDAASVSAIVQTAVNDVLSDRKTSKQAMDWAASEIHASLGNKAALTYPASN